MSLFITFLIALPAGVLLCGIDNNGLVLSLSFGPLSVTCAHTDLIWIHLTNLAKRGWQIIISHFYSHVGTIRNEVADEGASRALASLTNADHDNAPVDINDTVRAVRLFHQQQWLATTIATTHRHQLFGTKPLDLQPTRTEPELYVEVCRMRVNCSPKYGKLHRLYNPTVLPACRLCGQLKPGQGNTRLTTEQQQQQGGIIQDPAAAAAAAAAAKEANKIQCIICGWKNVVTKIGRAGMQNHIKGHTKKEKERLEKHLKDTKPHKCECGKGFETEAMRRVHRTSCEKWKEEKQDGAQQRVAERQKDAETIEDTFHFRRFCPGMAGAPQESTAFTAMLLRKLKEVDEKRQATIKLALDLKLKAQQEQQRQQQLQAPAAEAAAAPQQ